MSSRGKERRKAREKGGSEMTKFYYVLGIVGVVGLAILAYSVGSQALGTAATKPVDVQGLDDMSHLVEMAQGITKGNESAPVTIVEFADYSCPACASFSATVKPMVFSQYVDTGKAKFVYYDFPLTSIHPNSFIAARAGRCAADQGKFWEFQELAFKSQSSWAMKSGSVVSDLENFAKQAGVDEDAFKECLNSDKYADVVSANMRLGFELGINGTPTILVSAGKGMARQLQNFDFASVKREVDRLLQEISGDSTAADSTSAGTGG